MSVVLESSQNQLLSSNMNTHQKDDIPKPTIKNNKKNSQSPDGHSAKNQTLDKHTQELKDILKEIVGDSELNLNQDKALRELLIVDSKRLHDASIAIDETATKQNKDLAKKLALYMGGAIPIDAYQMALGVVSGPVTGAVRSAETLDGQTLNWKLITDPKATSEEQVEDFLNKYAPSPTNLTAVGVIDVLNPINSADGRPGGNIFNPFVGNYQDVVNNINKNANDWGNDAQRKSNILHVGIGIPLMFGATQLLGRYVFPTMMGNKKEVI